MTPCNMSDIITDNDNENNKLIFLKKHVATAVTSIPYCQKNVLKIEKLVCKSKFKRT